MWRGSGAESTRVWRGAAREPPPARFSAKYYDFVVFCTDVGWDCSGPFRRVGALPMGVCGARTTILKFERPFWLHFRSVLGFVHRNRTNNMVYVSYKPH